MNLLVIDGQGGGMGRALVEALIKAYPEAFVACAGTNAMATAAMLRAGAHEGATGENAIRVLSKKADVILGPIGIVIADAMLGETTPEIARCIGGADALKIVLPMSRCNTIIAGMPPKSPAQLVDDAVRLVAERAYE